MLIYFAAHTLAHFLYGGVAQLLRLFRPAKLNENSRTRVWALGVALISGSISVFALTFIDWNTRQTLTPIIVTNAPCSGWQTGRTVLAGSRPCIRRNTSGCKSW